MSILLTCLVFLMFCENPAEASEWRNFSSEKNLSVENKNCLKDPNNFHRTTIDFKASVPKFLYPVKLGFDGIYKAKMKGNLLIEHKRMAFFCKERKFGGFFLNEANEKNPSTKEIFFGEINDAGMIMLGSRYSEDLRLNPIREGLGLKVVISAVQLIAMWNPFYYSRDSDALIWSFTDGTSVVFSEYSSRVRSIFPPDNL